MCDDIEALVVEMMKHNVTCGPVQNLAWGLLTQMTLPGGGKLGIYQPRHKRPKPMDQPGRKPTKRKAKKLGNQTAKMSKKKTNRR
jgi:hypothetical protein